MSDPLFDATLDNPRSHKGDLSTEWLSRVQSELRRDEQLIWMAQPRPALLARQTLGIVIFGALWTTVTLFVLIGLTLESSSFVHGSGNRAVGWLIMGFFLVVGLGMLSSPYWLWRMAKQTCYALTNRRAIIWEGRAFGSVAVRSFDPRDLTRLYRVEYRGGGDLIFDEAYTIHQNSEGDRSTATKQLGFLGIEEVQAVEELLRRTLLKIDD